MDFIILFQSGGLPLTGLSPVISTYKKIADGADEKPPEVSELGGGVYKFSADPAESMIAVADGGEGLSLADRYHAVQIAAAAGATAAAAPAMAIGKISAVQG